MKPSVLDTITPQYIVDDKGKKIGVVLDIKTFTSMVEELENLYEIIEAEKIIKKKGKRYTLEEVEKSLSAKK